MAAAQRAIRLLLAEPAVCSRRAGDSARQKPALSKGRAPFSGGDDDVPPIQQCCRLRRALCRLGAFRFWASTDLDSLALLHAALESHPRTRCRRQPAVAASGIGLLPQRRFLGSIAASRGHLEIAIAVGAGGKFCVPPQRPRCAHRGGTARATRSPWPVRTREPATGGRRAIRRLSCGGRGTRTSCTGPAFERKRSSGLAAASRAVGSSRSLKRVDAGGRPASAGRRAHRRGAARNPLLRGMRAPCSSAR